MDLNKFNNIKKVFFLFLYFSAVEKWIITYSLFIHGFFHRKTPTCRL